METSEAGESFLRVDLSSKTGKSTNQKPTSGSWFQTVFGLRGKTEDVENLDFSLATLGKLATAGTVHDTFLSGQKLKLTGVVDTPT